jgi:hypothetical protein
VVQAREIASKLRVVGKPNIITDGEYLLCSDSFIAELNKRFAKELWKWNLSYSRRFDCDNFAVTYWNLAAKMFARDEEIFADSVALGCISYREKVASYHMINWYINEDSEVVFVEPQRIGDEVEFTCIDWANARYILC